MLESGPYTAGMIARLPRLAAWTALAVVFAAPSVFAQAAITAVEGKVEVAPGGINAWIAVTASPPYKLKNGDRVRTSDKGTAKIVFPDKSHIELEPGSAFSVEKADKASASLKLDGGELQAWVAKGLSRHFRVTTPSATATAKGTEFRVEVLATQDTQVEVNDGVVVVKLKNGEETELGTDRPYRSLLVIPGRALVMLPHPREDAGGAKSTAEMTDCLHGPNGAARKSVEAIEACQGAAHKNALSSADAAALREHERQEIKRFLTMTGALPSGAEAPAEEAAPAETASEDGAPAPVSHAASGGRDLAAEHAALLKEAGLDDGAGAAPLGALTPDKVKFLQDALTKSGADPALSAALTKATSSKSPLSDEESRALLKSLKLDQLKFDASGLPVTPPETPPDPDAP
jgi:hypothetical protein